MASGRDGHKGGGRPRTRERGAQRFQPRDRCDGRRCRSGECDGEIVVAGRLVVTPGAGAVQPERGDLRVLGQQLHGLGAALVDGLALGEAVLHHPPPQVTRFVSENPELETARLERAMQALRFDVDRLVASGTAVAVFSADWISAERAAFSSSVPLGMP